MVISPLAPTDANSAMSKIILFNIWIYYANFYPTKLAIYFGFY